MADALPIHCGDTRAIGSSLRLWRALRRMKQTHAAQVLGVSQATVSRWESGRTPPTADETARLRALMATRMDGDADRVLARLVGQAATPMHLVCDLTHRLLAASPKRAARFKVPASQLMGQPLWRFASEDIVAMEARLAGLGWFEPAPPLIEFHTRARDSAELAIADSDMRWTRLQLSDGSFARLVETNEG